MPLGSIFPAVLSLCSIAKEAAIQSPTMSHKNFCYREVLSGGPE